MLHERNDDKASPVREGTNLEGNPGKRSQTAHCADMEQCCRDDRPEPSRPCDASVSADHDLHHATGQENEHQVRADGSCGCPSDERIGKPSKLLGLLRPDPPPTRWDECPGCVQSNSWHSSACTSSRTKDPNGRVTGKKNGGQGKDEEQARKDQAKATKDGSNSPPQPPGAVDGKLRCSRTRKEVRGCNAVLKVLRFNPRVLLDTEPAEQDDLGGRAAKGNAPNACPLSDDRSERHPL